uniref:Uncharacterized protein n=1 Tax=Macrostomum lignano TaxID=282301 RepID=A0A1I8F4H1_9PLAT
MPVIQPYCRMQPIHSPESIRMRISVWIECSPGFYGRGCDVRCEPQRGCCCDSEGLLRCDETIDCSAQLATKRAFPTSGPGGAGSSNGNSDNRNRDEAVTNLSTIVSTSAVPANNRTDSGVYEDPQEPPSLVTQRDAAAAPAAAAAAAKLHSTSSTTNRNFKMSDSIRPREICSGPRCGSP